MDTHNLLRKTKGHPDEFECVWYACRSRASEWAFDHRRPGNLFLSYSDDPEQYVPLCGSHHEGLDAWMRRERVWQEARMLVGADHRQGELLDRMHKMVHSGKAYTRITYAFTKADLQALIFSR